MTAKKQTKTSKNPATKSKDKNPYKFKGDLLPHHRLRIEDGYIPEVAKYPAIFEYINNFENNKKYLLLTEGTKEEHIAIMEYVLTEFLVRKIRQPDKQLRHILWEDKEVSCLNKDNSKLKLEVYDRVINHKRFWEELVHDLYFWFGEDDPILDDFYRYSNRMSKDFEDEGTKADYEIYREIDMVEDNLLIDIYKRLKEYRGKNISVDRICKRFRSWLYNTLERRCKILSLIDISSNNNEFWLGYTTELMQHISLYKPDLIMATLKKGENVESLPQSFLNMFEIISLDKKDKQQEGEDRQKKAEGQEIMSVETTLSYNKITGKFRFGSLEAIAISKTQNTRIRRIAEKLMKWWKKGKPCPLSEIVTDPTMKTPQGVHDDISTIRNILFEYLKVDMPLCAEEAYHPPSKPEHFNIVS